MNMKNGDRVLVTQRNAGMTAGEPSGFCSRHYECRYCGWDNGTTGVIPNTNGRGTPEYCPYCGRCVTDMGNGELYCRGDLAKTV